jgi:hypothetical protein
MQVVDADIQNYISSSSFVFAPFVDWYILLPMLENRSPQVYVGNEILRDYSPFANSTEKKDVLAKCNELGRKFLGGKDMFRVPEFELHEHALEGLAVYWLQEEED